MKAQDERDYCRQLSQLEPPAGTAPGGVSRWVLLEDGHPWGAKPLRVSQLPEPAKAWLSAQEAAPGVRTQLIRKPCEGRGEQRRLYVVDASPDPARRRVLEARVELSTLAQVELPPLMTEEDSAAPPQGFKAIRGPFWLVCSHGQRDRCCAKWGVALWQRLSAEVGDSGQVWQSSHLGGHRFAPVAVSLPSGLMWGRLDEGDVPALVGGVEGGTIPALSKLRGRCFHARPVQAAEALLRGREGWTEDACGPLLRVSRILEGQGQRTEVLFERAGESHAVTVERVEKLGLIAPVSCGDEPSQSMHFVLRE